MSNRVHRAIWASLAGAALVFPADVTGLHQESKVDVNAHFASAPFEGDIPPVVWAISFSPDGKRVALGVQFLGANFAKDFISYLIVVSRDRPEIPLQKFEIPLIPVVQRVSRLTWSWDGRFVGITPYGQDWNQAAVVDLDFNRVHVVTNRNGSGWCRGVIGFLPGPEVVEYCPSNTTAGASVKFFRLDGTMAQDDWTFPGVVGFLDIGPDGTLLGLDFPGPHGKDLLREPHKVLILNVSNRTEVRTWSLPEANSYRGAFANSGTIFCTERVLVAATYFFQSARSKHEFICRDITSGQETLQKELPLGAGDVKVAGKRMHLTHNSILPLPFTLFDANEITLENAHEVWDVPSGRVIARWNQKVQKVTPKATIGFQFDVSPNGGAVAIGGSGTLTFYSITP